MRGPRRGCLAVALAAALAAGGCGQSFTPGATKQRDAAPLASVYDLLVRVPDMQFPLLAAAGLEIELSLEIDLESAEASGPFAGRVTIRRVVVGGIARPFSPIEPLPASGLRFAEEISVDSFGPIEIGDPDCCVTGVHLSLTGTIAPDGRSMDGAAVVTSSGEIGSFHAVKQRRYLVAGTDFGVTGTVSLVTVRFNTRFEVARDLEAVSGDPVVRATGGAVLAVNRFFFDNIQSLDPASGFRTALQFSTGNGSNPHDALAVAPDRLYVTRYEAPYNDILIADLSTGRSVGFVDMSGLATNASGTPRPDGLAMAEGLVFASLQDIDSAFLEYGRGVVAIVDPATDTLAGSITLEGSNPFGPPASHPVTGDLYYAMAGIFQGSLPQELSGGVEVVDPRALIGRGILVDDDALGGNVSSVALARAGAGTIGYCVVTTAAGLNEVRAFDADTGAVHAGFVLRPGSFVPEVVSDGDGYILVPVRDLSDPRLLVLDAASGVVVASPRLSLPPFSIAVLTRDLGGG